MHGERRDRGATSTLRRDGEPEHFDNSDASVYVLDI